MENNHLENEEIITGTDEETAAPEVELEAEVTEEPVVEEPVIEEPVVEEPVVEEPVVEEPVAEPAYSPAEESVHVPMHESIVVHEVEPLAEEVSHVEEKTKKSKKKKKLPDNEFEFDDEEEIEKEEGTKGGFIAFLRSVRFKRIFDKVSLGLLIAAFAIPVALLVYIILGFFL